jgi:hypothetical protein
MDCSFSQFQKKMGGAKRGKRTALKLFDIKSVGGIGSKGGKGPIQPCQKSNNSPSKELFLLFLWRL